MRKMINHPISIMTICLLLVITLLLNPPHRTESAHLETSSSVMEEVPASEAVHIDVAHHSDWKPAWLAAFQKLNNAWNKIYEENDEEDDNRTLADESITMDEAYSSLYAETITESLDKVLQRNEITYNEKTEIAGSLPSFMVEVTAYFLNIREQGHADSKILKTVKQGDQLTIVSELENGWLELESDGYINGNYVKRIEQAEEGALEQREMNKPVTIQSYTEAVSSATDQHPQQLSAKLKSEALPKIVKTVQKDKKANQPTSTVDQASGLTSEQIEKLFGDSALAGHGLGEAVLEMEVKYGVNAFFTVAVMKLESGHGKSKLAKQKNNLFGLNAIDGDGFNKGFSFKTKSDSVEKFAQLISKNYVGKGLDTIEKVAKKYCPTNSKWPSLVKSIMKSDYKKAILH